jgi:hypothetical protein
VSAQVLREQVLAPTLDAIALNARQHRLFFNPTVEADSMVEHLQALARTATPEQAPHVEALLLLVRDAVVANTAEGGRQRVAAGAADGLLSEAHRCQRQPRAAAPTVKGTAALLRGPLDVLGRSADYVTPKARASAAAEVAAVIDATPVALLVGTSLRHELGVRKFTLLGQLVAEKTGVRS